MMFGVQNLYQDLAFFERSLEELQAHIYNNKGNLAGPDDIMAIVRLERAIIEIRQEIAHHEATAVPVAA